MSNCEAQDLTQNPSRWIAFWGVPFVMIVAGGFLGGAWQALTWTAAFTVGGTACVANAKRCSRKHCFMTGPLYLLAAIASAMNGLGLLHLDWMWIGGGALLGTLFAYGFEWIGGKYVGGGSHPDSGVASR